MAGLTADDDQILHMMGSSLNYNRIVGNSYSASLYFGLASLLETDTTDLANTRVGLFSYGSGCVGEFFTGMVAAHYRDALCAERHQKMLAERKRLSFAQYLDFYKQFGEVERSDNIELPVISRGRFRLGAIRAHKRQYVDQQRQQ